MDNRELKLSSRTITYTLISRAAQAVGSLLLLFLTARWGGAQVRGEISVLLATLTLVSHLASWVGGGTLVYWVIRHSPRHLFYLAMAWSLGVSLFCGFLLPISPYGLSIYTSYWVATLVLLNTSVVVRSMLVALNQIRTDNLLGLLALGMQIIAIVLLMGFMGQNNLPGFLMAYNFGQLILLLAAFYPLRYALLSPQDSVKTQPLLSIFRSLFKTGSWAQMASLSQFFAYRLLYYFLSLQNGYSSVGRFSVAVALGESVWLLTRSVSLSQATTISRMASELEAQTLTKKWYNRVGLLSAFFIGGLLVVPGTLWMQLLGSEFSGIPTLLLYMSPGLWFLSISNILAHHQAGLGRYAVNAYSSFASLMTLALGLLFMRSSSLESVAGLQSMAYLVGWAIQYRSFHRPITSSVAVS